MAAGAADGKTTPPTAESGGVGADAGAAAGAGARGGPLKSGASTKCTARRASKILQYSAPATTASITITAEPTHSIRLGLARTGWHVVGRGERRAVELQQHDLVGAGPQQRAGHVQRVLRAAVGGVPALPPDRPGHACINSWRARYRRSGQERTLNGSHMASGLVLIADGQSRICFPVNSFGVLDATVHACV